MLKESFNPKLNSLSANLVKSLLLCVSRGLLGKKRQVNAGFQKIIIVFFLPI